jgi:hypothetical protein
MFLIAFVRFLEVRCRFAAVANRFQGRLEAARLND